MWICGTRSNAMILRFLARNFLAFIPSATNTVTLLSHYLDFACHRISLRHNGIEVVSAYGDASGYQMGSQSAVLNLRSGDRVYLQLDEGRLYDSSSSSRGYTTLSGFRIQ
uniref:C1q domain-containing protein n=1 Tax=Scylla olivacea TaxID=85551 RepID=A0A0P4W1I7_SCYOL